MNPTLLFPAGLAALAALAVPLVIHLARQSEVRAIDFAALRWLEPVPRPRQRLRFDEWLLLVIRIVLLALVALWLARPALSGAPDTSPWIVAVPGVDPATVPIAAGAERRWLSANFPPLDRPAPFGPVAIASLLRQLDAELPPGVGLRVLVPPVLDGVDAERPRLSRPVSWMVVPGRMAAPKAVPVTLPKLVVRYASERAASVRYLRAAATAWSPTRAVAFDAATASQPLPAGRSDLVWLVPGPLPEAVTAWVRGGGTALLDAGTTGVATPDTVWSVDGTTLVMGARMGAGRVLRLTRPLVPTAIPQLLDPDFPDRLRALFAPPPRAPARVAAVEHVPLTGAPAYPQRVRNLQPWLALVIAGVLLVERWLATGRRRGAAQ